jgi:hypothetical protein
MPRIHKDPVEEFFSSVNAIIKATPKILQDVTVGIVIAAFVQAVLSMWIPV